MMKLKKLMKEDKQFVFMVKELMKIEAALLSAKRALLLVARLYQVMYRQRRS
jgi:hypothetical protein